MDENVVNQNKTKTCMYENGVISGKPTRVNDNEIIKEKLSTIVKLNTTSDGTSIINKNKTIKEHQICKDEHERYKKTNSIYETETRSEQTNSNDENEIHQNKTNCMERNGLASENGNSANNNEIIEDQINTVNQMLNEDDDKTETRQTNCMNNNQDCEKSIRPKKGNSEENKILQKEITCNDDNNVIPENQSKDNQIENKEDKNIVAEKNINNASVDDKNEIIVEKFNHKSCPKTFGTQSDLDAMKNNGQQIKDENKISDGCRDTVISVQYTCTRCSDIFVKKSAFNRHMVWHTWQEELMQSALRESWVKLDRINIFCCNVCTRGFTKHTDLVTHRNCHYRMDDPDMNKKPFLCNFCGKRFVQESTLEAHSVLHKPFPHICICGIGYYLECDLIAHQRILKHFKTPKVEKTQKVIYKDTESESEIEEETKYKAKKFKYTMKSKPKTVQSKSNEGNSEFKNNDVVVKSEYDADDYKPSANRIRPRLKASLSFKQPKNKVRTQKKSINTKSVSVKKYLLDKFGSFDDIFDIKRNKNGKYECEICGKSYEKIGGYKNHMVKSHQWQFDNARQCKECGKKMQNDTGLIEHYLFIHKNIKPYKCEMCNVGFTQMGALQLHNSRHSGVKNFACNICNRTFFDVNSRERHMRTHTGEKPFECRVCSKRFADPSAIKRHELIHTGLKPHKCKICPKAFCDSSALYRHNKVLHKQFRVPCTECNRKFHSKNSMLYHRKITHGKLLEEEKHECDYCNKKFGLKFNLISHIKRMHLSVNVKCECKICGSMLVDEKSLIRHMNVVHLKILPFECDVCKRRFPNSHILKKHKSRIHEPKPDKKYTCDYCLQQFHYKSDLQKHIVQRHLGIKCEFCHKVFNTSVKLAKHMKEGCKRCQICHKAFTSSEKVQNHIMFRHTNKNEQIFFDCEYCPQQFVLRNALNRHIRNNHVNVKSYQCDNCGKSCTTKITLTNHIWDVHMTSARFCDVCMKRFYSESDFLEHKSVGCDPLRFPCQICDKKFSTRSRLRVHLLFHGPKKAECDLCGARFATKNIVLRHLRLVHKHKVKK